MDSAILTVLFSIVASAVAFVGAWLVARKYASLGGGAAQQKLNATYQDLNTAFETQIGSLKSENATLKAERAGFMEERQALRRERLDLKQELDDLRAAMRDLQKRATKAESVAKRDEKRVTALEINGNGDAK